MKNFAAWSSSQRRSAASPFSASAPASFSMNLRGGELAATGKLGAVDRLAGHGRSAHDADDGSALPHADCPRRSGVRHGNRTRCSQKPCETLRAGCGSSGYGGFFPFIRSLSVRAAGRSRGADTAGFTGMGKDLWACLASGGRLSGRTGETAECLRRKTGRHGFPP